MIQNEIDELEKRRLEYLEADDNRTAGRIEKQIERLRAKQELQELGNAKRLKASLDRAEAFIERKGMYAEYNRFEYNKYEED